MAKRERQGEARKAEVVVATATGTELLRLEAQMVSLSGGGIYFTAPEGLPLVVDIKGKGYRGRLIRAFPTEDGMVGYAVVLDHYFETAHTPGCEGVPAEARERTVLSS